MDEGGGEGGYRPFVAVAVVLVIVVVVVVLVDGEAVVVDLYVRTVF